MRKEIIERTDGVPLFVEEMTKAMLEVGGEDEWQTTQGNLPRQSPAGRPCPLSTDITGVPEIDAPPWAHAAIGEARAQPRSNARGFLDDVVTWYRRSK